MMSTTSYPGSDWETCSPQAAGLKQDRLRALAELVQGRGCVVRGGRLAYTWGDPTTSADLASAAKPVLSTLLLLAIQEGRISSPDEPLVKWDARLAKLNPGKDATGKDAAITWRHLASQTSGYGLSEAPGAAYAYNDFALALYYQTLMERVYQADGTAVLASRLAGPLGFQDAYTYDTFPNDRPGRLSLSMRDFARFGLLYLREGAWNSQQVLRRDLLKMAISSPVPANIPHTRREYAEMLPGQRSMGGTRHITTEGPGYYSFNWWLNGSQLMDQARYPALPGDAFQASGHGAQKSLWVIPGWDMVVAWHTPIIQQMENRHDPLVAQATELLAAIFS